MKERHMRQLSFWDVPRQLKPTDTKANVPIAAKVEVLLEKASEASTKCSAAAQALQKQIEAKHRIADTLLLQFPTRKSLADAATARREAIHMEQVQATLSGLAAMHEGGNIPVELSGLTSRGAIESALFTSPNDSVIRTLYNSASRNERRDERIRRMSHEALLQRIPGYSSTSAVDAERLIRVAQILPGNKILEPSAGTGSLIDAALKRQQGVQLFYCELNCFLLDVLREKYEEEEGVHFLGRDFMELDLSRLEHPFDRIIMNPPLERGQDAEHLRRAYPMLAPGGILAGIIRSGIVSRKDARAKAFREFLQKTGAVVENLQTGTLKNNGVASAKIVHIQAPMR
jgi:16S rRNA G1207 methylase RsmC